jgi:hypothetical protein
LTKEINKGHRILVQVGLHHAFTKYRQPLSIGDSLICERPPRMGCILYRRFGDKVFQVVLHQRHPDSMALVNFLERVFQQNGSQPVGLDISKSPFELLRDDEDYYFRVQKRVVLADIAQGYVFLKPLSELQKVRLADGFVDEASLPRWQARGLRAGWVKKGETLTAAEMNERARIFDNAFDPTSVR